MSDQIQIDRQGGGISLTLSDNRKLTDLITTFEKTVIDRHEAKRTRNKELIRVAEHEFAITKSALAGIILAADFSAFDMNKVYRRLSDIESTVKETAYSILQNVKAKTTAYMLYITAFALGVATGVII